MTHSSAVCAAAQVGVAVSLRHVATHGSPGGAARSARWGVVRELLCTHAMRSLLAVLTLLVTGHAVLAEPAVEPIDRHELAELPQYVRAIAPLPGGGALVLGR